eukprot:TRINITY_DN1863_c0_g1_i2.p1 TRINITY_DN1863_c0_g1~~TRINITY_DN1863_c0_g1_i2.p1  ORF type:complete len:462 (+),score=126.36 TRINITY_DN1863_c0_g1_i2:100-1485(+)
MEGILPAAAEDEKLLNPAPKAVAESVMVRPSAEDLEKLLEGQQVEDLRTLATRLTKTFDLLKESHDELETEKTELEKENNHLRETIELMVTELRKLNINMENTVEPRLEEGPLDFVGRFWEMMKPRDNQVLVTENIGELKRLPKPTDDDDEDSDAASPAMKRLEDLREAAAEKLEALDELPWQAAKRLETLRDTVSGHLLEIQNVAAERVGHVKATLDGTAQTKDAKDSSEPGESKQGPIEKVMEKSLVEHGEQLRQQGEQLRQQSMERFSDASKSITSLFSGGYQQTQGSESSWSGMFGSVWQQASSAFDPTKKAHEVVVNETCVDHVAEKAVAQPPVSAAEDATSEDKKSGAESSKDDAVQEHAPTEERELSEDPGNAEDSMLIVATIHLDDGTVQVCRVGARDRSKDVAARFIRDHSLKCWFEEPLNRFLKKVEAEADRFPVEVEANLLEIRQTYSKR